MSEYKPMFIAGMDPSFAHFGLAVIDMYSNEIKTYDIAVSLGKQSFLNVCNKANEQVNNVIDHLMKSTVKGNDIMNSLDLVIGMENALPHAFNATALTALDCMLYFKLGKNRTAVFNPTYLSFLMGKHTKRDSVNLAMALLKIFQDHNFNHVEQAAKKLTDGEAEAFIYSTRMYCRTYPESDITKDILSLQPLFSEIKENFDGDFIY